MAIPQIIGKELVYASTAIFGFAMSTVYGNAINFVSKRMNLSGSVQKIGSSNLKFLFLRIL